MYIIVSRRGWFGRLHCLSRWRNCHVIVLKKGNSMDSWRRTMTFAELPNHPLLQTMCTFTEWISPPWRLLQVPWSPCTGIFSVVIGTLSKLKFPFQTEWQSSCFPYSFGIWLNYLRHYNNFFKFESLTCMVPGLY